MARRKSKRLILNVFILSLSSVRLSLDALTVLYYYTWVVAAIKGHSHKIIPSLRVSEGVKGHSIIIQRSDTKHSVSA